MSKKANEDTVIFLERSLKDTEHRADTLDEDIAVGKALAAPMHQNAFSGSAGLE